MIYDTRVMVSLIEDYAWFLNTPDTICRYEIIIQKICLYSGHLLTQNLGLLVYAQIWEGLLFVVLAVKVL